MVSIKHTRFDIRCVYQRTVVNVSMNILSRNLTGSDIVCVEVLNVLTFTVISGL
ncbi:Uncharacterised protein [Vibrio cholerae]|uniref:Uncharacterized protein n=1 Tax=Vibrio cholerae TaxID=666 RepID=A0A655XU74_VIBCL|nr:Uncharacterised protein [Vibrio cholerae]